MCVCAWGPTGTISLRPRCPCGGACGEVLCTAVWLGGATGLRVGSVSGVHLLALVRGEPCSPFSADGLYKGLRMRGVITYTQTRRRRHRRRRPGRGGRGASVETSGPSKACSRRPSWTSPAPWSRRPPLYGGARPSWMANVQLLVCGVGGRGGGSGQAVGMRGQCVCVEVIRNWNER